MPDLTSPNLTALLDIQSGHVVALIGAGGKHTLMDRLGRELHEAGRPVVLTSTTNLHRHANFAAIGVVQTEVERDWVARLREAIERDRRALLVGDDMGPAMFRGVDPETVVRTRRAVPDAVVIVKADGARKRMLKAPAAHEPVFPPDTDLCMLVQTLAALGKPVNDHYVHRLDVVRNLTSDETIRTGTIVDVIRGGYLERLPPARRALYLSCAASPAALEDGQRIADALKDAFDPRLCGDTINGTFVPS